jgi:rhodanese-related sulfurtransferase
MGDHYRYNTGMPVKRVPPSEAAKLLEAGYRYVDVRSSPEFQTGHPPGAYNIPLNQMLPGRGMVPNPEFEVIVAKYFGKDDPILLGCASGPRSLRAAEMLMLAGYTDIIEMRGGWNGERDSFGRIAAPGWRDSGLPIETDAPGRTWEELK